MMKTLLKNIVPIIVVALLAIPTAWSQTYKNDNGTENGKEKIQGEKLSPELLANMGINTSPNPKNATVEGNSVYVRQIGGYNIAQIQSRTAASDINLTQNGDYNDAYLDYTANTVVADIVQNGNSNRIRDFVNNPGADISLDLIQEGNSLNFEREGVNELTKSLKFRQTEASPSLIIRSYY